MPFHRCTHRRQKPQSPSNTMVGSEGSLLTTVRKPPALWYSIDAIRHLTLPLSRLSLMNAEPQRRMGWLYHGRLARAWCVRLKVPQFLYCFAIGTGETPVIR